MRLSAHRIRSINRSIARANGIIYGALDTTQRSVPEDQKPATSVSSGSVVRIVAVPKAATP